MRVAQRNINLNACCIHGRSRVKSAISTKRMPSRNKICIIDRKKKTGAVDVIRKKKRKTYEIFIYRNDQNRRNASLMKEDRWYNWFITGGVRDDYPLTQSNRGNLVYDILNWRNSRVPIPRSVNEQRTSISWSGSISQPISRNSLVVRLITRVVKILFAASRETAAAEFQCVRTYIYSSSSTSSYANVAHVYDIYTHIGARCM